MSSKKVLITGSSGFIGGHLVRRLKKDGCYVIGVDIELPKYEEPDLFYQVDLRDQQKCNEIFEANKDIDELYNLACLMGGMAYVGQTKHSYDIMIGSTEIITNILDCCIKYNVKKYFYSSSACAYNMNKQRDSNSLPLKETDIFPAMPDLMYGWQKIMGELMAQAAVEQHGLDIRIARFHNVFGHEGIYSGGKQKAPASISRKVAEAVFENKKEVFMWGTGEQSRSFLFINDAIDATLLLMKSDYKDPINIGSEENIKIKDLWEMVIDISGRDIKIGSIEMPPNTLGVMGRNSDNTLIRKVLGWEPKYTLKQGMEKTYHWIYERVTNNK